MIHSIHFKRHSESLTEDHLNHQTPRKIPYCQTKYLDTIESDVITMAIEASDFSNLHAWCWTEDMQMLISNNTMTLQSARKFCQEDDSLI